MRREFAGTDLGGDGFPRARHGSDDGGRSPDKPPKNAPVLVFGEIGIILAAAATFVAAVNIGLTLLHIH